MCQDKRAVSICSGVGDTQVIKWCALFGTSVNVYICVCECVCVCFPTVQVFNTPQFSIHPEPAANGSRKKSTLQQQLICTLCYQALRRKRAKVWLLCPLEDNYDSADSTKLLNSSLLHSQQRERERGQAGRQTDRHTGRQTPVGQGQHHL